MRLTIEKVWVVLNGMIKTLRAEVGQNGDIIVVSVCLAGIVQLLVLIHLQGEVVAFQVQISTTWGNIRLVLVM